MSFERLSKYLKSVSFNITLTLGEFSLKNLLGQGGNGVVYGATINNKEVAIKFLVTDAMGGTKNKKIRRFLAEYFNIITIEDPSFIVRYIDYDVMTFEDGDGVIDVPVIIMKRYSASLKEVQKEKTKEGFLKLFRFLIDSIKNIHDHGIVHRDIKPENILVDGAQFALADFGIANFNPEMFKILADTEKKERLGNRLFSAPEQENAGIEAHPTMDIYAIGQVLQWYATGSTHRGTGRRKITHEFPELTVHDRVIDKCLEQDPKNRFQSIEQINEYIERSSSKDIFNYLHIFNKVCRMSFPRNEYRIVHSNEREKIDRLFSSFNETESAFDNTLWWVDGTGSYDQIRFFQKGNGIWKLNTNEYDITDVWVHYDNGIISDFVFARYQTGQPFEFEAEKRFYSIILNGKYTISSSEYDNGFAEIEGSIIDLSTQSVEYIERQNRAGFFVLGTYYTCIIQWQNEEEIASFIDKLTEEARLPTIEELREFERKTRRRKNPEVLARL